MFIEQHTGRERIIVKAEQPLALERDESFKDSVGVAGGKLSLNRKEMVLTTLASIGSRQKHIFSASAGEQSLRSAHERQTGIHVFHILCR